jgi:hypothetical protein
MATRLEIKQQIVREMGKYELVTDYANGDWSANASAPVNIDKVIQDAQTRLDEMPWKLREQLIRRTVSLAVDQYEFDLPKPIRCIKRIDLETATERSVPELYQQSIGYMRENYAFPWSLVDSDTPIDWARQVTQGLTVETDVVLNGGFDTDLSSWTLDVVNPQVWEAGACRFTGSVSSSMSQNISTVAGKTVTFGINVTEAGGGIVATFVGATGTVYHTYTFEETGMHKVTFALSALVTALVLTGCPIEHITNGGFNTDLTGWDAGVFVWSSGKALGTGDSAASPSGGHLEQTFTSFTCVDGEYTVSANLQNLSGTIYIAMGSGGSGYLWTISSSSNWSASVPSGTYTYIQIYGATNGITVDNVSIATPSPLIDDVSLTYEADDTTKDILIMPPAGEAYTLNVFGTVYDDALSSDASTSIWSVKAPSILVNACKAIIKESQEDWQGAQQYWNLCKTELRKIDIGQRKEELSGPPENFIQRG